MASECEAGRSRSLGAQIQRPGDAAASGGPAWRLAPLAASLVSCPRLAADTISSRRRLRYTPGVSAFPPGATAMPLTIEANYENGVL